jgi:2-polyprenyl-3-methyl-5-hydroxy-6-metoxy-1,4-benzoquinol methylase
VIDYVGTELGIFKHATNWKTYYGSLIAPYLGGDVVEIGAGMGVNTALFCSARQHSWVCVEPDGKLAQHIRDQILAGNLPACCRLAAGTIEDLPPATQCDSILYIDVLEHICDDKSEVQRALGLLRPGGHLIVMAPAHQFLFSPFDAGVGHFRRYTRRSLRNIVPARLVMLRYLDSVGLLLSLGNRLLLRQSMPTLGQIQFWDKRVIPVSRIMDPLLAYRVGKSVLGVWQR